MAFRLLLLLTLFLMLSPHSFADCNSDAESIKSAISKVGVYRQIQNIRDQDGAIKTFIYDTNDIDRARALNLGSSGRAGIFVIVGSRMWNSDKLGQYVENTTSSEASIARGVLQSKKFKIDITNGEIQCSNETAEFGQVYEKLAWTVKEKADTIKYELWADPQSHLPLRQTWDYKGIVSIADSKAVIIYIYSNELSISQPQ